MTEIANPSMLQGHKALWRVESPIPNELIAELGGLSPMLCHLLYCRGYRTPADIARFFAGEPDYHDPMLLPDMGTAVARISRAIDARERVAIYGDFDCDGLTAAAILAEVLASAGLETDVHIPARGDGHGLHVDALSALARAGVTLVVAADCGVTAIDEVAAARTMGLDVIVTDHHEARPDGVLPDAPVINPTRYDSVYPFRFLSGVGVAFKLVQGLASAVPSIGDIDGLLDLVALGTVADVVPLRDENRRLVVEGVHRLQTTKRPGLLALFDVAGVDPARIDPVSIAFYLAPRINAANRLADPGLAYRLLTTHDPAEARELAAKLGDYNRRRQELIARHGAELTAAAGDPDTMMEAVQRGNLAPAVVAIGEWPAGISGLLASTMVERYGLPSFVGTRAGDGTVAVSARGIAGVYIDEILESCESSVGGGLFLGYGGHAGAGGFRVPEARWELARSVLDEQLRRLVSLDTVGRVLVADADVPLRTLSMDAARMVRGLAPFGAGFEEPLFLVRNARIRRLRPVGADGRHAKVGIQQGDTWIDGVHFNADSDFLALQPPAEIDLLCHLQINEWQGNLKPELRIRDWREAC